MMKPTKDQLAVAKNRESLLELWREWVILFPAIERIAATPNRSCDFFNLSNRCSKFFSAERGMHEVLRWESFFNGRPEIRAQTIFQHTYSSTYAVSLLLKKIKSPLVDSQLLQDAFYVHNFGKGLLKRDLKADLRDDSDNLLEYQSVVHYFDLLDNEQEHRRFHRAFALQYVYEFGKHPKEFEKFPQKGIDAIERLWRTERQTAIWFRALELWGYFIYALEQLEQFNNTKIIANVILESYCELKEVIEKSKGLSKILWTEDISNSLAMIYKKVNNSMSGPLPFTLR